MKKSLSNKLIDWEGGCIESAGHLFSLVGQHIHNNFHIKLLDSFYNSINSIDCLNSIGRFTGEMETEDYIKKPNEKPQINGSSL